MENKQMFPTTNQIVDLTITSPIAAWLTRKTTSNLKGKIPNVPSGNLT